MRLATYNVQNLFERARALNGSDGAAEAVHIDNVRQLNELIAQEAYGAPDKARMVELIVALGGLRHSERDPARLIQIREIRGRLLQPLAGESCKIVASGRSDWTGFLEMTREVVPDAAVMTTARVVYDLNADVLAMIEVEGRPALLKFNERVLGAIADEAARRENQPLGEWRRRHLYENAIVIDGNDQRGIDVGLLTRRGHAITYVRSHVDDRGEKGKAIFSRDCPEFLVITPNGARVWVLVNHFKSRKGKAEATSVRRKSQALRVAELYQTLMRAGEQLVAVVGDLNDTLDSASLAPLLACGLIDAAGDPRFDLQGFDGTWGRCGQRDRLDHVLLSPVLASRMIQGGIFRAGLWGAGKTRAAWPIYPEIHGPLDAASDHAAVWVDIDV